MGDVILSLIRTWVPIGVGYLVAWGLLPSDLSDEATLAFAGLITAAYYGLVRLLESKTRFKWIGWLLGSPKEPSYGG